MSDDDQDDWEAYVFHGKKREKVPRSVRKLTINPGVQYIPDDLCRSDYDRLEEVTLPNGLKEIGNQAFAWCESLFAISISNTVQRIGREAFRNCKILGKVEFEFSASSPHQLQTVDEGAFMFCDSLARIKLPASVLEIGEHAFHGCLTLEEANLSSTGVTEISDYTFHTCYELLTASLPNTVERISDRAFYKCNSLKTVAVPLDSRSIDIGQQSFYQCTKLTNIAIPKDSTAEGDSFLGCDRLKYYSVGSPIVASLGGRFEDFPIHRICYYNSDIKAQELRQCIADNQGCSLLDTFTLNPFHIFFSTIEPRAELLEVLLDLLPHRLLQLKDEIGARPLDSLVTNWTNASTSLFKTTIKKSMIDSLARWGLPSWRKTAHAMVQDVVVEDDKKEREILCCQLFAQFEHYENVHATSMLEMALWKWKLKSGWRTNDHDEAKRRTTRYGIKRQTLDRGECRCVSGSDVVIPNVAAFLNISPPSSPHD